MTRLSTLLFCAVLSVCHPIYAQNLSAGVGAGGSVWLPITEGNRGFMQPETRKKKLTTFEKAISLRYEAKSKLTLELTATQYRIDRSMWPTEMIECGTFDRRPLPETYRDDYFNLLLTGQYRIDIHKRWTQRGLRNYIGLAAGAVHHVVNYRYVNLSSSTGEARETEMRWMLGLNHRVSFPLTHHLLLHSTMQAAITPRGRLIEAEPLATHNLWMKLGIHAGLSYRF